MSDLPPIGFHGRARLRLGDHPFAGRERFDANPLATFAFCVVEAPRCIVRAVFQLDHGVLPLPSPWVLVEAADVVHSSSPDAFMAAFEITEQMPSPTVRAAASYVQAQALDFAYGNLAASSNHKPDREVFRQLAADRYGWSSEQFDQWAAARRGWRQS